MSRVIDLEKIDTGFGLLNLDPDYTGSCPCATIEGKRLRIETNCWRTRQYYPDGSDCGHDYVCAHVWGTQEQADRVKTLLDPMDWYGEWTVVVEPAPSPMTGEK